MWPVRAALKISVLHATGASQAFVVSFFGRLDFLVRTPYNEDMDLKNYVIQQWQKTGKRPTLADLFILTGVNMATLSQAMRGHTISRQAALKLEAGTNGCVSADEMSAPKEASPEVDASVAHEAVSLYLSGLTIVEVSKVVSLPVSKTYLTIRSAGVTRKAGRKASPPACREGMRCSICIARESGMTLREIGESYGFTRERARQITASHGAEKPVRKRISAPKEEPRNHPETEREYFNRNITKSDDSDGCWFWNGAVKRFSYGRFEFQGLKEYAHRASYRLHVGDIPGRMWILHRCDNPPCVNRAHLYIGTACANVADRGKRGRHWVPKGHQGASTKLTTDNVLDIRDRLERGESVYSIAKVFCVGYNTIAGIAKGRTWKHTTRTSRPSVVHKKKVIS